MPTSGAWRKLFDSDAPEFGGSGTNTQAAVVAGGFAWQGQPACAVLHLPPLGCLIFEPSEGKI
jgi:1,4-alpha-glucan branching enzyme